MAAAAEAAAEQKKQVEEAAAAAAEAELKKQEEGKFLQFKVSPFELSASTDMRVPYGDLCPFIMVRRAVSDACTTRSTHHSQRSLMTHAQDGDQGLLLNEKPYAAVSRVAHRA